MPFPLKRQRCDKEVTGNKKRPLRNGEAVFVCSGDESWISRYQQARPFAGHRGRFCRRRDAVFRGVCDKIVTKIQPVFHCVPGVQAGKVKRPCRDYSFTSWVVWPAGRAATRLMWQAQRPV